MQNILHGMPIEPGGFRDFVAIDAGLPEIGTDPMKSRFDGHASIFALKHEFRQAQNSCNSTVAPQREMREIGHMSADEQDRERRRAALLAFFKANKPKGLKSVLRWATKSGVAEATVRQLLDGTRAKNMRADTYEKLARGASLLLDTPIRISDLLGEEEAKAERIKRAIDYLASMDDESREKHLSAIERDVQRSSDDSA